MTNSSQQQLLFVTSPGGTRKSFLIRPVVGHLTLCQEKFVEVLASSGSAAYLLLRPGSSGVFSLNMHIGNVLITVL